MNTYSDSQRRAPYTDFPTPGTSTMASRISPSRNSHFAHACHWRTGTAKATSPAPTPINTAMAWRTRKCVEA